MKKTLLALLALIVVACTIYIVRELTASPAYYACVTTHRAANWATDSCESLR